jgi:enterochelin esterase-like enzyme
MPVDPGPPAAAPPGRPADGTVAGGTVAGPAGAWSDGRTATFRLADPRHRLAGVRLWQDVRIPGDQLDFRRSGDGWRLDIARPPVNRMEYLYELRHPDGGAQLVTDPASSRLAPGAFGEKSVLEFPEYQRPGWLTAVKGPGGGDSFDLPVRALEGAITVRTWRPADAADGEPLPLLVANDGPEYDTLASLTGYLAAGIAGGWLPRLRAALLAPGPRDRWYSANTRYTRALTQVVIPALTSRLATTTVTGMGASLGGLAMLQAHCRYPDVFGGLFLQSGSFFRPSLDSHERRFPYYPRIVRFTGGIQHGSLPDRRIPVTLTCGVIEENAGNNRLMAQTLQAAGYPVTLAEVPDMHNYTAWRDGFDPHLTRLLARVCP